MASGHNFLYIFLCTGIVDARFDAVTGAAHRLAQAVVVLRTCVYPCTDCRRQQLLDRAGRGHAAVFLLVIYLFWKRQRQSAVLYLIVLALLAAALLVSILAPGNALRQESVGEASVIRVWLLRWSTQSTAWQTPRLCPCCWYGYSLRRWCIGW